MFYSKTAAYCLLKLSLCAAALNFAKASLRVESANFD